LHADGRAKSKKREKNGRRTGEEKGEEKGEELFYFNFKNISACNISHLKLAITIKRLKFSDE
jgi:hypothetical protein